MKINVVFYLNERQREELTQKFLPLANKVGADDAEVKRLFHILMTCENLEQCK